MPQRIGVLLGGRGCTLLLSLPKDSKLRSSNLEDRDERTAGSGDLAHKEAERAKGVVLCLLVVGIRPARQLLRRREAAHYSPRRSALDGHAAHLSKKLVCRRDSRSSVRGECASCTGHKKPAHGKIA